MNKLLKGSIAGAAGIVLLFGGAGTFAVWNSSVAVLAEAAPITSGNLLVNFTQPGKWSNQFTADLGGDIASYRIVPGDVLTYTQTFDVTAEGDTLVAELGLTEGSIKAGTADPGSGQAKANAALVQELTDQVDYTLVPVSGGKAILLAEGLNGVADSYTYKPGDEQVAEAVTVTATITFPLTSAIDVDNTLNLTGNSLNASKTGVVDLSAFAITLTQVLPNAAE